jgi:hypothetical protein
MSAENPHLFRCPVCGEALIVFARGEAVVHIAVDPTGSGG